MKKVIGLGQQLNNWKIKHNFTAKSWMGVLGVLGFLGFLGSIRPSGYIGFAFFGFFGWYWEGKLNEVKVDERLIQNFSRAQQIGYRVGMAVIFIALVIVPRIGFSNAEIVSFFYIIISLSFAVTLILIPYLTYRFDSKE